MNGERLQVTGRKTLGVYVSDTEAPLHSAPEQRRLPERCQVNWVWHSIIETDILLLDSTGNM